MAQRIKLKQRLSQEEVLVLLDTPVSVATTPVDRIKLGRRLSHEETLARLDTPVPVATTRKQRLSHEEALMEVPKAPETKEP